MTTDRLVVGSIPIIPAIKYFYCYRDTDIVQTMATKKPEEEQSTKVTDLAKPITERIQEANEALTISHYQGPPRSPTSLKAKINHRAKVICYLKAIGFKNKDIAASLSAPIGEVYRVLKSHSAQDEIERIQHEIFVTEPAKMFETILPQAVKIAVNAMMNKKTKTSVRVDAAFKFMDRALGKPTQHIEHEHNLVKELITKLDQENQNSETIDAEFFNVSLDKEAKDDGKIE